MGWIGKNGQWAVRANCDMPKMRRIVLLVSSIFIFVASFLFFPLPMLASARRGLPRQSVQAEQTLSSLTTLPACTVWPGWRERIPGSATPEYRDTNELHLGTLETMSGSWQSGCIPAKARLGPFGHSSNNATGDQPPWDVLNWRELQYKCRQRYFSDDDHTDSPKRLQRAFPGLEEALENGDRDVDQTGRTAVVLRAWDSFEWSNNQIAWVRALITELSLDTGGQYEVHILIDVHDADLDLLDDQTYASALEQLVPKEFREVALLFNTRLLREWYPEVGHYLQKDQVYQALQIFSYTFPDFDFVWQLEMDARFTGNVAAALSSAGRWAQIQPRKNLWERNARWYIPELWNQSYAAFSAHVDAEIHPDESIWGPHPDAYSYVKPEGPTPPARNVTSWGVGEQPDLITFAPIVDPVGSDWTYEQEVHGFDPIENFPRRMAMISITRTSRRLLRLISVRQRKVGSWVVSESTAETWSLLHGLKAVYVPHLVTFNPDAGFTSAKELDGVLHKGSPSNLAGGLHASFLYSPTAFLPEGRWLKSSYFYWMGKAPELWYQYTNGTCTYPLLLHPVKDD